MCLATVYVEDKGEREEIMRDVAWLKPESNGLELTTLLGESKLVQAEIKSINLLHSLIVLKRVTIEHRPPTVRPISPES